LLFAEPPARKANARTLALSHRGNIMRAGLKRLEAL
jgi:hypothetical protein